MFGGDVRVMLQPDACKAGAAQQGDHFGFLRTRITESPLKNILVMKRSLLTG